MRARSRHVDPVAQPTDNDADRLAPDHVESVCVISDASSNLLHRINDILDLSKIEAGEMDVLIEPVTSTTAAHKSDADLPAMARR